MKLELKITVAHFKYASIVCDELDYKCNKLNVKLSIENKYPC